MNKKILIGSMLVFTTLLLMSTIPAVQHKTIEDKAYKPTCIPFITYPSHIYSYGNYSEILSPIPPGNCVVIPYYNEYSISVPQFLQIVPWPLNTLWLFYSFVFPAQKIYFANSDVSDYIDVFFSPPLVYTNYLLSGEKSNSSTYLIICIGENTPCDIYNMKVYTYCKNVGRIKGDKFTRTITFTVGY